MRLRKIDKDGFRLMTPITIITSIFLSTHLADALYEARPTCGTLGFTLYYLKNTLHDTPFSLEWVSQIIGIYSLMKTTIAAFHFVSETEREPSNNYAHLGALIGACCGIDYTKLHTYCIFCDAWCTEDGHKSYENKKVYWKLQLLLPALGALVGYMIMDDGGKETHHNAPQLCNPEPTTKPPATINSL